MRASSPYWIQPAALASHRWYSTAPHLTHTDEHGKAAMVDVSYKSVTKRIAEARATVVVGPVIFDLVAANQMKKGDVLSVAQIAGILGAKQTSNLIPLCHPLPLQHIGVNITLDHATKNIEIRTNVVTSNATGVEMEALTAASIAALTVYDMCKAVSKDITIKNIQLVSKSGGVHGDFSRTAHQ